MTFFSVIFYLVWVEDMHCSISPIPGPSQVPGTFHHYLNLGTYILMYVKGKTQFYVKSIFINKAWHKKPL